MKFKDVFWEHLFLGASPDDDFVSCQCSDKRALKVSYKGLLYTKEELSQNEEIQITLFMAWQHEHTIEGKCE